MKKVLTLVSIVSALLGSSACSPSFESQIIGKWQYNVSMDIADDDAVVMPKMELDCVDEVLPNKSSKTDCKFRVAGDTKAADASPLSLSIDGAVVVTNEWSIVDKIVYEKIVDSSVTIDSMSVNGEKVTDATIIEELTKELNSTFVKGDTQKIKTISIDSKKWVYETEVDHKNLTITATRM